MIITISPEYQREIERKIHDRVRKFRQLGKTTSKGELMSLRAIGKALDPPVTSGTMTLVVQGRTVSARVRAGIERELGEPYWPRNKEREAK